MTEGEAKTTRCCGDEGCGIKREIRKQEAPFNEFYARFCIGSACMAWRWVTLYGESDFGERIAEISKTDGYCGLAGKP